MGYYANNPMNNAQDARVIFDVVIDSSRETLRIVAAIARNAMRTVLTVSLPLLVACQLFVPPCKTSHGEPDVTRATNLIYDFFKWNKK